MITRIVSVCALIMSGGLASCGMGSSTASGPSIVQPGSPGQPTQVRTATDIANATSPAYSAYDVDFMQAMIGHHRQALAMTSLIAGRSEDRDLALLANRIELTQRDEIALMEHWLESRGESLPDEDHMAHMPGRDGALPFGMLNEAELAELRDARGDDFDRLFLRYMIRHHGGAVEMVRNLFASPDGGQETEVFQFASAVASDQPIEIARMQRMLGQQP